MEQQNLKARAPETLAGETPVLRWVENGEERSALWHSEAGVPAPKRVQLADDTMTADTGYRLASEGTALLWRGDFQNARQLLQAMARRMERKPRKERRPRLRCRQTAPSTGTAWRRRNAPVRSACC